MQDHQNSIRSTSCDSRRWHQCTRSDAKSILARLGLWSDMQAVEFDHLHWSAFPCRNNRPCGRLGARQAKWWKQNLNSDSCRRKANWESALTSKGKSFRSAVMQLYQTWAHKKESWLEIKWNAKCQFESSKEIEWTFNANKLAKIPTQHTSSTCCGIAAPTRALKAASQPIAEKYGCEIVLGIFFWAGLGFFFWISWLVQFA